MPYMFSQGAADVPCTLLHFEGGELVDVAKGRIVQPGNPMFHGNPMPPTVYSVEVVQVLPGCNELLPPVRPAGADEEDEMTLSACVNWPTMTTTTVHLPTSISTLPNMGTVTSSVGLLLKNPTKTAAI